MPRCARLHRAPARSRSRDRKSTRLNSSHTEIYTLSLHDALPISSTTRISPTSGPASMRPCKHAAMRAPSSSTGTITLTRSEEHTSELQSHRDLHSFPTRRSSDLVDDEDLANLGTGQHETMQACRDARAFIEHRHDHAH